MKVVLDWVANHTAWDHNWIQTNPEYYAKNEKGEMFSPNDWSDVVQLDHHNIAQQNAMVEAMLYWVKEFNVDGFRCDMAHLTPLDFWQKARVECDSIKPLFWLAECQEENYFEAFDVIYGWEWLHKMEQFYKKECTLFSLVDVMQNYNNSFLNNKFRLLFTSNHDENSWQGSEYERLGNTVQLFAVLCAALPGIPLIYSGQEEPLHRKLDFFNKDEIGFKNLELHDFYKKLAKLKLENAALAAENTTVFQHINTSNNERLFAFLRTSGESEMLLVANMSASTETLKFYDDRIHGNFINYWEPQLVVNCNEQLQLNAWQFLIWIK
jgi:glycosidase